MIKNFHLDPEFINRMPYWEYELMMDELNDQIKKDNEEQENEMKKYDIDSIKRGKGGYDKMIKNGIPNYSIPSIPKIPTSFK